jgi:hypothetical protein
MVSPTPEEPQPAEIAAHWGPVPVPREHLHTASAGTGCDVRPAHLRLLLLGGD